jgi:uncharacterized protein (DUF983 family)
MTKDLIKFGDLGFGKCPHCSETTTFFPTETKSVFECEICEKKVKQYKNGKVHWFKIGEEFTNAELFK